MNKPVIRKISPKRILMIAYFFPPIGGAGALRPMKLAKYLPEFGWLPVILSAKNPDWYYAADPDLLTELPDSVKIFRSAMIRSAWVYRAINPFRIKKMDKWIKQWFLHPDPQIGWLPSAVSYGLSLINRYNIKAIYSTSAPLSSHLIAHLIKKKTGLPWVADFRDEWFENPDINYPTRFHSRMHYQMEGLIVRHSDHIIAAAPGFCNLLRKHNPSNDKISTLIMGYDPEDFEMKINNPVINNDKDKFTIGFSGLFYGSFKPTRFLDAVSSLIEAGKISSKKVRIVFVGANALSDIRFKDIYNICTFTGFIPHRQSIGIIKECDALLLLLSKERGDFVIPSKTFEYMATGKPILAVVPENGTIASFIHKTDSGLVVDFDDCGGMKLAFLSIYKAWEKNKNIVKPRLNEIEKFNQKKLTCQMSEILNSIVR